MFGHLYDCLKRFSLLVPCQSLEGQNKTDCFDEVWRFFVLFKPFHVNCFYFLPNTEDDEVILSMRFNDVRPEVCFVWM